MNPILHDLHNKQWVWTAANAKQNRCLPTLGTGFENFDKVLSGGFPRAGLIHVDSPLGCGELRLMLSVLSPGADLLSELERTQKAQANNKLQVFINPPFELNAEFLLAHNLRLEQLIVVQAKSLEEALWSAEQCAKSGACHGVFLWQPKLQHKHIRKLELAAQQGGSYCIWLQNQNTHEANLPLSLSLSLRREGEKMLITVNKQKVGWAQKAVKVPLPFTRLTNRSLKHKLGYSEPEQSGKVVSINAV